MNATSNTIRPTYPKVWGLYHAVIGNEAPLSGPKRRTGAYDASGCSFWLYLSYLGVRRKTGEG